MQPPKDLSHLNELIISRISYCAESGMLTWLPKSSDIREDRRWNTRFAGKLITKTCDRGYISVVIRVNGKDKKIQGHRVCWFLHYGEWPMHEIDHENHKRSDNRISNMRKADRGHQNRNLSIGKRNTSGYMGVDFYRGQWRAQCKYKKKNYFLGMYNRKESAAAAIAEFRIGRDYHENHGRSA